MEFQQIQIEAEDGRTIEIWRLCQAKNKQGIPIIIASGFAKRMSVFSGLAQYLARNGFDIYRYDPLDHVGMSDGDMRNYNLDIGYRSLQNVFDWVKSFRNVKQLGLVATSMSARLCYRMLSKREDISFLVTAVGVTALRSTLEAVFEKDYFLCTEQELPVYLTFDDHFNVSTVQFSRACQESNWTTLDSTRQEVSKTNVPIIAFVASNDDWVNLKDVEYALIDKTKVNRHIYQFGGTGHDLGRNKRVTRLFLSKVTSAVNSLSRGLTTLEDHILEPNFRELVQQSLFERRIQSNSELKTVIA